MFKHYTIKDILLKIEKRFFRSRRVTVIKKALWLGLFLCFICLQVNDAHAQRTEISGTVTDASDGSTLPGVNIIVPGTTIGATSDFNGNYTISVPESADSLSFSFIGYVPLKLAINNRTTINVSLEPDIQQLEDVVVVGYGTQERKQITGSVTSVREDQFVKGAINDPNQLINGKVPGLTIDDQGGNPNGNPEIRLRGISSFGANQEPLVVIDGIIGGDLNNVDPNDIQSIEVLKDASAAAIYGTRGSGGVILVTTKKGGSGEENFSISYNGYITGDFIENELEVLSADEFVELGDRLGKQVNNLGGNTNFQDEITQTGLQQVHSLSMAGGLGSTNYRLSANFRDIDGIQESTGFQRLNARLNLSQSAFDDMLTFTVNLSVSDREEDIGFPNAFRHATTFNPTAPVRADGFENTGGFVEIGTFDVFNPVSIVQTGSNSSERKNFNGAFRTEYDFSKVIPGLTASAFYSIETINNVQSEFYEKVNKFRGNATQSQLGTGLAIQNLNDQSDELFEATLSYKEDFSDLSVDIVAGYSWNNIINEGSSISGGDFIADAVRVNNFQFAQDFNQGQGNVASFKNETTLAAGFTRVSLNWDDTYFLNGSVRREGSSRFGQNNKWGNFWAIGGSVELIELIDIPKFERLKFRASFGKTGQNSPLVGLSQLRFAPLSNFFANGAFIQSFGPVSNPNPDLQWEEKTELNLGIDFGLFRSRITGTVEAYFQNTDELLFPIEVAVPPNLFPTTWRNVGELENNGVEITLNTVNMENDQFSWNSTLTSTFFGTTELTQFAEGDTRFIARAGAPGIGNVNFIRVAEGEEIGQIWGPKFFGFATEDQAQQFGTDVGTRLCEDPEGGIFNCLDRSREQEQVLGSGLPDYQFGLTNNINYKNFDFSLFVRGVFGHDIVNTSRAFYEALGQLGNFNLLRSAKNLPDRAASVQPGFDSRFVESGDFVRLQNLTLGYTLPINNSQISRVRVYFSGNNLFTITGYDGVNPTPKFFDGGSVGEGGRSADNDDASVIGGDAGGALAPGVERRNNWFTIRSFTLGVNLDF